MGGGPLMGCAKPLAAFQLRFDHLSPIFQLPFELDSKPQSLSPSLTHPNPSSFASRSFIGRRSAHRPTCVIVSCRVLSAC
jgi:hypothetical protein